MEGHDADTHPTETQPPVNQSSVGVLHSQETNEHLSHAQAAAENGNVISPPEPASTSVKRGDPSREDVSSEEEFKTPPAVHTPPPIPPVDTSSVHPASDPVPVANGIVSSPALGKHEERLSPASSELEKDTDLEAGKRGPSPSKQEQQIPQNEPLDPNTVDWDGPDDPQNARNWSSKKKWANIAVIASITFLTYTTLLTHYCNHLLMQFLRPLASSMFAPGIPEVMNEFKSDNVELASFVVSIYILGYALGPIVLAPLSELYGRLPLYHSANLGFVIFTVACALSTNLNMLIGFRFVEGLFGSCPLTIGGGTIADMIVQEKRGGVMAIWALGPLMGPVIGPVAGGYLSQSVGWRWVFWVIAIAVRPPWLQSARTIADVSNLGRRNLGRGSVLPPRILPRRHTRSQSQSSTQRNRQPSPQIQACLTLHAD